MNLPHPLDRPHQLFTAQQIVQSSSKFIAICAATGSGKSSYAAHAASQGYRVLVLVKTKSLQPQYEKYGFVSITGKGDYKCKGYGQQVDLFNGNLKLTADLCEVPNEMYQECKYNCEYPLARYDFWFSGAGVTSYAKFLSDKKLIDDFHPDIIFLDEGHELADNIVIERSGLEYNWKRNKRILDYTDQVEIELVEGISDRLAQQDTLSRGSEWLHALYNELRYNPPKHPSQGGDVKLYKWHKHELDKVDLTLDYMNTQSDVWFVRSNEKGFVCKPLTSQFHFLRLFDKAPKIVLMSATIGKNDIEALGIKDYEFIRVPNVIPASDRPIVNLNCPPITWQTSYEDKKKHAQIMSDAINKTPDWYTSLVLFPSKAKSEQWAEWLQRMTRRSVFVPERGISTDKTYDKWLRFKDDNTGAICCAWQFWTGIDAGYLNTVIVADMPFPNLKEPYENTRFHYNRKQARHRISNLIEQGMGRNRRGDSSHYGSKADKLNYICGGKKWKMLKSACQKEFLDSVIKV